VAGYHVYRRRGGAPREERLTTDRPLPAAATRYVDETAVPGTSYHYAVAAVRPDGSEVRSAQVSASVAALPTELLPNRPNPFNPATELRYRLAREGHVTLTVFDLSGRRVRTLVDGVQTAGAHVATWDGRDATGRLVPAGVYFGRLRTDDAERVQRLVLLK